MKIYSIIEELYNHTYKEIKSFRVVKSFYEIGKAYLWVAENKKKGYIDNSNNCDYDYYYTIQGSELENE